MYVIEGSVLGVKPKVSHGKCFIEPHPLLIFVCFSLALAFGLHAHGLLLLCVQK